MGLIGDIYYAFRGDGARLQKDAQVEGAKAGTGLGKSMAANLKKSWSGKEIGKGLVQGLGLAGGLGAAALFSTAISKVTDLLGDATAAALEEETSIQKLGTALRNNVPNWNGETAGIEKVLKARMALGFSDDEQRASIATLVGATKDQNKALELGAVAMDISRARNIDLATASAAVAKAYAGNTKGLKSLLPGLKLGATSAETLANAYAMVKGSAEDYARTNAGKLLVSQVKVGESLETLGAVTMPLVVEGMTAAADAALALSDAFTDTGDAVKDNEDPLQNFANIIHDMFKSPDEEARTFFGSLFDGLNGLQRGLQETGQDIHTWLTFWDSSDEAANRAARTIHDFPGKAKDDLLVVTKSIDKVGDHAGDMADDVVIANTTVGKSWDDLKTALVNDANELIDDAFNPQITMYRLQATNAEIAAAKRILASSTASNAEKHDAKVTLASLAKDQASYLLDLAEAGQTGSKAYKQGIKDLKTSIKNATGPTKTYLQGVLTKLQQIDGTDPSVAITITTSLKGGFKGGARAEGGPVTRGLPYLVGERGPEIIVPTINGTVLTNSQSVAAMAGGGRVGDTNITLALPVTARPDPFETADALRRLNDFGVLQVPA